MEQTQFPGVFRDFVANVLGLVFELDDGVLQVRQVTVRHFQLGDEFALSLLQLVQVLQPLRLAGGELAVLIAGLIKKTYSLHIRM